MAGARGGRVPFAPQLSPAFGLPPGLSCDSFYGYSMSPFIRSAISGQRRLKTVQPAHVVAIWGDAIAPLLKVLRRGDSAGPGTRLSLCVPSHGLIKTDVTKTKRKEGL